MTTTLTKSRPAEAPIAAAPPRNPWSMLRSEMDDLLARFWNGEEAGFAHAFAPALDLSETPNAFALRMDIPGMEAKDIEIQVRGNTVTVSGQRKEEREDKTSAFHRIERRRGSFWRTISLPCDVNEDEVAAEYAKGVLNLTLPKSDVAKGKKIAVKS